MLGWIVVLVALAALLFTLLSDVEMKLRIDREAERDRWKINFRWLYGLVCYSIHIPALKWKGNQGIEVHEKQENDRSHKVIHETKPMVNRDTIIKNYRKAMQLIQHTFEFSRWFKQTVKHVRCRELYWQTTIGVGEPVETATLTGLAWSLKSSLIGYISKHITLQIQPILAIEPRYHESAFATEVSCIFKFRTGYAMLAGILLIVRIIRIKGGMKTWRNILFKAS